MSKSIETTVIKLNDQNPHLITRLEAINVSDHLGEAKIVLRKSREQSKEILRDAKIESARELEVARAKGFEAGFKRGYESGRTSGYDAAFAEAKTEFAERQAQLVKTLKDAIEQFDAQKRDVFIAASGDMLDFAMQVAKRVTHRIGVLDRESASENLRSALQLVESKTELTVHVNPADVQAIKDFAGDLSETTAQAKHFRVEEDDSIAPGGCRLVTPITEVDATLETQLAQIAALVEGGSSDGETETE
ncbi:MAG: hypothetical protein GXP29_05350 [Planctomycetes bacterium]|nr:hypothetical protein [Planctomycetota bacterium]